MSIEIYVQDEQVSVRSVGGVMMKVDSELSLESENPVQNKVVTAKFDELSEQKADKEDLTNQFNFKGSTTFASLPTQGNAINDTYYCTDMNCCYSWNGEAWYQSSIDESVYLQELSELKEHLDEIVTIVKPINLFDKDNPDNLEDKYVSTEGEIVYGQYYYTSSLIKLGKGTYTYKTSTDFYGGSSNVVPIYDENGNFLNFVYGKLNGTLVTFTLNDTSYVRLKLNVHIKDTVMLVVGTEYPSDYISYHEEIIKLNEDVNIDENVLKALETLKITNPLYNKKLSANGDSICYENGKGGYAKIISERNNMAYQNIAIGGGTITAETYSDTVPRHWISRTIDNMDSDSDYIIIEGGVNDCALNVPLGAITSDYESQLDDTTFYGALETIFKKLNIRFIGKKFGFIIPHQMMYGMSKKGSYYNAIIDCAYKWGVPVLDLSKDVPPFNLFRHDTELDVIRNEYTLSGDGWHPNEKCYREYYVPKIESWLKTL